MKTRHHGSCHCGAVKFACELDLATGTSRCNCSICGKSRFWKAIVLARDFTLVQGEEQLADYQFGSGNIHHRFCMVCGVKVFGTGHLEAIGGDFVAVNVACLDDASAAVLAAAPVSFEDGRNGHWERAPAVTAHL